MNNVNPLPVIVIITSKGCGHCTAIRKDGYLQSIESPSSMFGNNGKGYSWNETFFNLLLRGGATSGPAKFRVYEIHYSQLQPTLGVEEFSEYTLTPEGKVKRIGFYNINNKFMTTTTIGYKSTKPQAVAVNNKTFTNLFDQLFPKTIADFVYVYPGWIYVDGNAWNNALKTGESFYAYAAQLKIIKENGKYIVDRKQESINNKPEDAVLNASKVLNGTISLKYIEQPPEQKSQIIYAQTSGCKLPEFQLLPQ